MMAPLQAADHLRNWRLPNLIERGLSIEEVYRDTSVPRLGDLRSPRL